MFKIPILMNSDFLTNFSFVQWWFNTSHCPCTSHGQSYNHRPMIRRAAAWAARDASQGLQLRPAATTEHQTIGNPDPPPLTRLSWGTYRRWSLCSVAGLAEEGVRSRDPVSAVPQYSRARRGRPMYTDAGDANAGQAYNIKGLNTLCIQSVQSRTRSSEIAFLRTIVV